MSRMLAAAAIAVSFAASSASAIVVNGDFETLDASVGLVGSGTPLNALSGTAWNVYDSIPGWTTVSGSGIEVQRGTVIAPHSGAFYVELDSHPNATNSGSTNTRMSQNLGALALGVYDLSFYYSPRTSNATSMDIAFDLAGGAAFSDTVGFADGAVGSWTLITRSFAVTSGADVVLSFAAGGAADRLGGFIDDVSITGPAPIPLPAAGWLLAAGLAALGFARRR